MKPAPPPPGIEVPATDAAPAPGVGLKPAPPPPGIEVPATDASPAPGVGLKPAPPPPGIEVPATDAALSLAPGVGLKPAPPPPGMLVPATELSLVLGIEVPATAELANSISSGLDTGISNFGAFASSTTVVFVVLVSLTAVTSEVGCTGISNFGASDLFETLVFVSVFFFCTFNSFSCRATSSLFVPGIPKIGALTDFESFPKFGFSFFSLDELGIPKKEDLSDSFFPNTFLPESLSDDLETPKKEDCFVSFFSAGFLSFLLPKSSSAFVANSSNGFQDFFCSICFDDEVFDAKGFASCFAKGLKGLFC